jgi:hypothetical protein
MPLVFADAGAGPARGSMRSAPMSHLSGPARASVLRRGCGLLPCPLLPRWRSDQRRLSPSGQPGGPRTDRLRSASVAASRAPSRAPGQPTCRAVPPAPTRRYRPGVQRPCGPHAPTPGFASHTRSATMARRSSKASEAAIGASRRSRSSAELSRPAGSSPTGTGPSTSVPSGIRCEA